MVTHLARWGSLPPSPTLESLLQRMTRVRPPATTSCVPSRRSRPRSSRVVTARLIAGLRPDADADPTNGRADGALRLPATPIKCQGPSRASAVCNGSAISIPPIRAKPVGPRAERQQCHLGVIPRSEIRSRLGSSAPPAWNLAQQITSESAALSVDGEMKYVP